MATMVRRKRSIYADIFLKNAHRARYTPRVHRYYRPRVIAWAGPTAFSNNRFYTLDKWYKARITKPIIYPTLHIIDPNNFTQSLEERLAKSLEEINIGFKPRFFFPDKFEITYEMELLAVNNKLEIDTNKLDFDQISVYKHFNIYEDLFMPGVYFHMTQNMNVFYGKDEVSTGNVICSSKSVEKPTIKIESLNNHNAYNTLFMLNIDGDFFESETQQTSSCSDSTQMLHWLVGNIPDGKDLAGGEELIEYIQPIPVKGTGYHRIAFVLFRHKEKLDFSDFTSKANHFSSRVIRLNRFYKKNEHNITPTMVKFCQMKWHESCEKTLKDLDMKIPYYNYEWNPLLPPPTQREFPEKPMPFNLYLDQYRSRKSIEKEMKALRLERLVREGKCEKSKYPDPFYDRNKVKMAPWEHSEKIKENTGLGKYQLLYHPTTINAAEQADLEAEGKIDKYRPEFEKSASNKFI